MQAHVKTTRLQVMLQEVTPTVRRVIDVPAAITLDELHDVLEVALGWTDTHLHQFRTGDAVYSMPADDWDDDEETGERGVRLSSLPSRFITRPQEPGRPPTGRASPAPR